MLKEKEESKPKLAESNPVHLLAFWVLFLTCGLFRFSVCVCVCDKCKYVTIWMKSRRQLVGMQAGKIVPSFHQVCLTTLLGGGAE